MHRILLGLTLGLLVFSSVGQEPQTDDAQKQEAEQPSEENDDADYGSDEDFIPTEEIPADKEVTFPVDI